MALGGVAKTLQTAGSGISNIGAWANSNKELTRMALSGLDGAQKMASLKEAAALVHQHLLDDRQAYGNSISKASYPTGGIVNQAMGTLATKYAKKA